MQFVLDASVSMRWLLADGVATNQQYAEDVLASMSQASAAVPNLWHLEVASVLLTAIRREDTTAVEADHFTVRLDGLPIETDPSTAEYAFGRTMALATSCSLSGYDAAYLELAQRRNIPLATLDKKLRRAAKSSSVEIYLQEK